MKFVGVEVLVGRRGVLKIDKPWKYGSIKNHICALTSNIYIYIGYAILHGAE